MGSPVFYLSNGKPKASSAFFAVQRPAICIRLLQYLRFSDVSGKIVRLEITGVSTIS